MIDEGSHSQKIARTDAITEAILGVSVCQRFMFVLDIVCFLYCFQTFNGLVQIGTAPKLCTC